VSRPGSRDVDVGAALCAAAAAYLAWTVHWTQPPSEDAAMLLRYAVHVAAGDGTVWSATVADIDGRRDVGELLAAYRSRNYTLVTSEAGLLPFYSGWKTIDAWGLNDADIARTGGVTSEYLDRFRPAVVSFHAYFSPLVPPQPTTSRTRLDIVERWDAMTRTLYDYADSRGYHLAACFGLDPGDTHYYYVRPDLPDSAPIIDAIRSTRYYDAGRPAIDFSRTRHGAPD
jgi:hypothetical protein